MKKALLFAVWMVSFSALAPAALAKSSVYRGSGEVTSVDSPYGRLTIKHGAIKGYSGDGETEFGAKDSALLKDVQRRDLIDFELSDNNGDVRVTKITRTGTAPEEERVGVGRVVQDVLVGTGEVAKTVTSPIPPAQGVVGGAFDATTTLTEPVLKNADVKSKQDF